MVAKRKSIYHEAGDVYIHDCTMNAERYRSFMMQVFRDVKMKMPWLKGKEVIILLPMLEEGILTTSTRKVEKMGGRSKL
jgi:hypothetical protein